MVDDLAGIGVTEALGKLIRQEPRLYAEVIAGIRHYLAEHKRAKAECTDGPSVTAGFQRAMDEVIAQATAGQSISCSRGCAHCCYVEVHITAEEAELLLRYAEYAGIEIDWARLEQQARVERWRQLDYKARRCVFLGEDNTCQVYLHRPMNCRKYFVASDPERCNSQKYPAGETTLLTANRAEMMASALFSISGSSTIAKALLKLKEANEKMP